MQPYINGVGCAAVSGWMMCDRVVVLDDIYHVHEQVCVNAKVVCYMYQVRAHILSQKGPRQNDVISSDLRLCQDVLQDLFDKLENTSVTF